jgi:hypothetical protein
MNNINMFPVKLKIDKKKLMFSSSSTTWPKIDIWILARAGFDQPNIWLLQQSRIFKLWLKIIYLGHRFKKNTSEYKSLSLPYYDWLPYSPEVEYNFYLANYPISLVSCSLLYLFL